MRRLLSTTAGHAGLVAMLLVAWLTLTNHCALGLTNGSARWAGVHAKCCGGAPAQKPAQGGQECCKVLQAAPPMAWEWQARAMVMEMPAMVLFERNALVGRLEPERPVEHGPPRTCSFAELVLQRSLPSCAPPRAA